MSLKAEKSSETGLLVVSADTVKPDVRSSGSVTARLSPP
jgi:hypothetical protein